MNRNRRDFLAEVGQGMLLASIGAGLATELGLASACAADAPERLLFGDREPLVGLMEDTPANKLLPILVEKLNAGTKLDELVAAVALANARKFGGMDYEGYHCFMALMPALQMSRELPEARRALPVLKVIHRNAGRMQAKGGSKQEVLQPIAAAELPKDRPTSEVLREAFRKRDMNGAERTFAALAAGTAEDAYNHLQFCIEDEADVHRVVLSWRPGLHSTWSVKNMLTPCSASRSAIAVISTQPTRRAFGLCCRSCSSNTNCSANNLATGRQRISGSINCR